MSGIGLLGVAVGRGPLALAQLVKAVVAPTVDRSGGIQSQDVAVAHSDVHNVLEIVGAIELVAGTDLYRVDPAQVGPIVLIVVAHGSSHAVLVRLLARGVGVGGAGVALVAPGVDSTITHQGHGEFIASADLGDPRGVVGGG